MSRPAPDFDWYSAVSKKHCLPHLRCPFASVHGCPKYYESRSLLADAGSTALKPELEVQLTAKWNAHPLAPQELEQAPSLTGDGTRTKGYQNFCPEVLFERFGLFVTSLHHFHDEDAEASQGNKLRQEGALLDDPRWAFSNYRAQHYSECPVYAPLSHPWSNAPIQTAPPPVTAPATGSAKFDVFISHASEDKVSFVKFLAEELTKVGLTVWYDAATLKLGDSLSKKINEGLNLSSYGVVVLSHSFFAKEWPQAELAALVAQEMSDGKKRILPVRHGLTQQDVVRYSPLLADKLAALSNKGVQAVAKEIYEVVRANAGINELHAHAIAPIPPTKVTSPQQNQFYSKLVQEITTKLMLKRWHHMLNKLTIAPPKWEGKLVDGVDDLRDQVSRAVWPRTQPKLEASIKAVCRVFSKTVEIFLEHAEFDGDKWLGEKFYAFPRNNPNYDSDLQRFKDWMKRYHDSIDELVKCLNWFSDVVREEHDPEFFVDEGYFVAQFEQPPLQFTVSEIAALIDHRD